MSDTPRTDAESYDDPIPGYEVTSADFARQLERELAEAKHQRDKLQSALDNASLIYDAVKEERDKLAKALERIRRHGPIMGSAGDYRQGEINMLESVSLIADQAFDSLK